VESPLEVRRRIGYLPENAPLYEDMGTLEYLAYVADMRAIPRVEVRPRLARIVDVCGLGPAVGKKIGQLSKGFRQRVGLAQAMIHEPDILVLDEPTSGLDPN
jgi:ABC-2 type transport system ATP-binding protein